MLWNPTSPAKNKGWGSLLPSLKEFFNFNRSFFSNHLKGTPVPTLPNYPLRAVLVHTPHLCKFFT